MIGVQEIYELVYVHVHVYTCLCVCTVYLLLLDRFGLYRIGGSDSAKRSMISQIVLREKHAP